jgi:RHS repeat-associated protein
VQYAARIGQIPLWPINLTIPSGALTQKQDSLAKQTSYAYDALGRFKTRTWARTGAGGQVSTSYTYDVKTGDLTFVNYSDNTPDVSLVYDRSARTTHISDAAGTRAFTYHQNGEVQTEQIASGTLDGTKISYGYDTLSRRNSLQASRGATTFLSYGYTYDASSRPATVVSGAQTATYAYHSTSGLLNTTSFAGGASTARSYDLLGRLNSITNSLVSGGVTASYKYAYNKLSQRVRATREDGSYWVYGYNDRGELVLGKKYWPDNTLVSGQQTAFSYDNSGNRRTSSTGGDAQGNALRQSTFTANSLNQYSQRTNPGAVDVNGTSAGGATVTVNNESTYRRGDYFHKALTLDNSASPVFASISVVGAKPNVGGAGEDAVNQQSGSVYLPRAAEVSTYDDDGNLTADSLWTYTWDAENRLTGMESTPGVPAAGKRKLEYAYDFMGRRIVKKAYVWNVPTSTYQLQSTTKFVYDGWNLIAELDGGNAAVRTFTWGVDISGEWETAGGVGGLLLINEGSNTYQVGYDGNGNVAVLVKAGGNTVAATYEYDPFGVTLKSTGEYAAKNPFKFSTKYVEQDSGMIYYGYRYYNPQTGSWLSRDPLEEEGGINLYAFSENNSVDGIDYLGLKSRRRGTGHHLIPWSLFNADVSDVVFEFFNSDGARIFNEYYNTHNFGTLNDVSHRRYNQIVREELEKFLGGKPLRKMTLDEAKVFFRKIKGKPASHALSRFNAGVAAEAAKAMESALAKGMKKTARYSLSRAIRMGAKRGKRGLPYIGTVITGAYFAQDVYANGLNKAIDHEVNDQATFAESIANYTIQVYEQRKIQKLGGKLVDLCDIRKWW